MHLLASLVWEPQIGEVVLGCPTWCGYSAEFESLFSIAVRRSSKACSSSVFWVLVGSCLTQPSYFFTCCSSAEFLAHLIVFSA